jgi:hypothetical protein
LGHGHRGYQRDSSRRRSVSCRFEIIELAIFDTHPPLFVHAPPPTGGRQRFSRSEKQKGKIRGEKENPKGGMQKSVFISSINCTEKEGLKDQRHSDIPYSVNFKSLRSAQQKGGKER